MRTHALALAASVAALSTAAAPLPASAQGLGLGSVFSCNGGRGTGGAVIGGLAGALAGSQVSKNERTLGAVVGAGLGAFAGNQLACRMGASSRTSAERSFQRALDTGRTQSWNDPRSGARGVITVLDDDYDTPAYAGSYGRVASAADLRYARGVERIYRLNPSAPAYEAQRRVQVRLSTDFDAPVAYVLSRGETVEAAGTTEDGWIAIVEDGLVRGYAPPNVLRRVSSDYASGYDARCRLVQQTVTLPGYPTDVQRFRACRDGSGQWRLDPA